MGMAGHAFGCGIGGGPGLDLSEGVPGGHSFGGGIGAWRDMHLGVA